LGQRKRVIQIWGSKTKKVRTIHSKIMLEKLGNCGEKECGNRGKDRSRKEGGGHLSQWDHNDEGKIGAASQIHIKPERKEV